MIQVAGLGHTEPDFVLAAAESPSKSQSASAPVEDDTAGSPFHPLFAEGTVKECESVYRVPGLGIYVLTAQGEVLAPFDCVVTGTFMDDGPLGGYTRLDAVFLEPATEDPQSSGIEVAVCGHFLAGSVKYTRYQVDENGVETTRGGGKRGEPVAVALPGDVGEFGSGNLVVMLFAKEPPQLQRLGVVLAP